MKRQKHTGGFSLIEVLVTTVILGTGLVGVASAFTYARLSTLKSSYMAQARHIAEQTVDKVRADGYAEFTEPSGSVVVAAPGLPRATAALTWEPCPNTAPEDGLRLITVDITWRWASTTGGRYQVMTLVYKGAEG